MFLTLIGPLFTNICAKTISTFSFPVILAFFDLKFALPVTCTRVQGHMFPLNKSLYGFLNSSESDARDGRTDKRTGCNIGLLQKGTQKPKCSAAIHFRQNPMMTTVKKQCKTPAQNILLYQLLHSVWRF